MLAVPWRLDNAEERAAAYPRSFFIPPAEKRRSLVVGDEVKLIFLLEREDGTASQERMWVEVVETDPYVGLLRNEPELSGVIEFNARVPFGPEHVAAYAYAPGELGYSADERCVLSKRIADADDPPPLLFLNADGEWEAHAQDETEDGGELIVWTLGYLTDRFPQTAEALREGSARHGLLRRRARNVWWAWDGSRYARVEGA